ncbi:MAG: hypothetical protein JXJ04_10990 [Spirochaetales bacterium]|nr:hypothetical protein [Spirochaetales bacterium]
MNIESILQSKANFNTSLPKELPANESNASLPKEPQLIDEQAIKSILYLCIQGEINIQPEQKRAIDTFA